ncbi:MAG: birA [Chlamydiales bacterium]|jgi:BirA family biotin operon repressor/biotin-[acetyl-CoA-carboxylase] ligase|nr:birA [Chlamydiales bacterium]
MKTSFSKLPVIHYHFKEIDSTHTWARENVEKFSKNSWVLITAGFQSAGKGTGGRIWWSPAQVNIYATFVFFIPTKFKDCTGYIPQITAVSAAQVLEKKGVSCQIKWVNDIFLHNKKLGGILTQTIPMENEGQIAILLSIGLNVNMAEKICQLDQPITSLLLETGHTWDEKELIALIQNRLQHNLALLLEEGFQSFAKELNAHLAFLKSSVHFENRGRILSGIVEGVNDNGALRLRLPDGSLRDYIEGRILPRPPIAPQEVLESALPS